ncbi:MAG: GNAT family N-acetyltransferase [Dokdonella sp.]
MEIAVQPVGTAHRAAVLALRVRADQLDYVGTMRDMLLDAEACPGSEPMAILRDDRVVGYYRLDFPAAREESARLQIEYVTLRCYLVDASAQRSGIGAAAMSAICADLRVRYPLLARIALNVDPENSTALDLYRRCGFVHVADLAYGGRNGPQHVLHLEIPSADLPRDTAIGR